MSHDPSSHEGAAQGGSPGRPPIDPHAAAAGSPPPPPPGYHYPPPQPQKNRSLGGRVMASIVTAMLLLSILLNVYLGVFFLASTEPGPRETVYREGDPDTRVVILPIEGMITEDTHQFVRRVIQQLRDDPPDGLVLRVDSGGGGMAASDRIWRELNSFMQETDVPVVASFGTVAASGGYYVAASANQIFAEPTTITGSLGVVVQQFTIERLLDKIGITPEIVASSASTEKDRLSPFRAWDDDDYQRLGAILDEAHDRFVNIIVQGRASFMDESAVRDVATGEIFTAAEAQSHELIDGLGYMDDAIAAVQEAAGIDADVNVHVTRMSKPRGLAGLLGARSPNLDLRDLDPEQVRAWLTEMTSPRPMYYMQWR